MLAPIFESKSWELIEKMQKSGATHFHYLKMTIVYMPGLSILFLDKLADIQTRHPVVLHFHYLAVLYLLE